MRWIICHIPKQAAKDKADRDRQLDAYGTAAQTRSHIRQLQALGYRVTIEPAA